MSEPTIPRDATPPTRGAWSRGNAALGALFVLGVVLALTVEDARGVGLLLMILSAALFLIGTIRRMRTGDGPVKARG